jgi:integrase
MRPHMRKPRYVHEYHDRHGKPRIYLRRPRKPQVALPGPLYSQAFWTAYHEAMVGIAPVAKGSEAVARGSVSEAVVRYYSSAEYKRLATSTKVTYRSIIERFRSKHGDKPLARLETKHVNNMIDDLADTPAAATIFRKRLHTVMKVAIGAGLLKVNPVAGAKIVKYKTKGYRTWTETDIAAYRARWPIGTPRRLALEVLLYTGLRRSNAVRLGWHSVVDGALQVSIKKSQEMVELTIPIHPELAKLIARCPKSDPAFIVTEFGKPRTAKALTNWIRESAHIAGLPSASSPHGMRKAACRRLAEALCTPHQIQAITGHQNLKEIETYTKAVEQKRLAQSAMATVVAAFRSDEVANRDTRLAESAANPLTDNVWQVPVALPRGLEPLFSP